MLMTALTGVLVSAYTENLLLAVACALFVGVFDGVPPGLFPLEAGYGHPAFRHCNQHGGQWGTVFLLYVFAGDKGSSERLTSQMLPTVELPLLKDIPVLGEILSGHNVLTYVAFISVLVVWFLIFKTRIGLRIRAVGEYPSH